MMRASLTQFFILSLLLFGCTSGSDQRGSLYWKTPNGRVKVLCTIAMIHDLVQRVGGEYVDSFTLIKGELDPHSYQLVKGDDEKFAFADLIFFNGLGLEHGPSLQNVLLSSKKAIGLGNHLRKQFPERILYYRGQIDPHIWMDLSLWSDTLPYIVAALSEKDPEHASIFQANANQLKKEMDLEHRAIVKEMQEIPNEKRYLVTSHDAFQYFVRAYLATDEERDKGTWHPRCAAPEGLAPESQLSVTDIQDLIAHLSRYHIELLFPESNVSKDSIRKIVAAGREKGLQLKMASEVLYADAMGPPGSDGESYLKMIRHDADAIMKNLK